MLPPEASGQVFVVMVAVTSHNASAVDVEEPGFQDGQVVPATPKALRETC